MTQPRVLLFCLMMAHVGTALAVPTVMRCGAGRPSPTAARCECPAGAEERTEGSVSMCVALSITVADGRPPGRLLWPLRRGCDVDSRAVEGGWFMMGSREGEGRPDERPRVLVEVAPFCMMTREVTARAYLECVDARACTPPGRWAGCSVPPSTVPRTDTTYDRPISCVTQAQAAAFCAWRNMRLPTEAEWEFAARGATGARYPWGTSLNEVPCLIRRPGEERPVEYRYPGNCAANLSAFGVADMVGSLWEWTADVYVANAYATRENVLANVPVRGAAGALGVARGGSWRVVNTEYLGATVRYPVPDEPGALAGVGIRCIR